MCLKLTKQNKNQFSSKILKLFGPIKSFSIKEDHVGQAAKVIFGYTQINRHSVTFIKGQILILLIFSFRMGIVNPRLIESAKEMDLSCDVRIMDLYQYRRNIVAAILNKMLGRKLHLFLRYLKKRNSTI